MAELPISSSSSLPPSGSSFPDVSYETPQSTRSVKFSQPILPTILPLATRSPPKESVEFNWPPQGAWSSFGSKEKFPPLTSGPPFIAVAIPPIPRHIFEDIMASEDMDSSSPVSCEGTPISIG